MKEERRKTKELQTVDEAKNSEETCLNSNFNSFEPLKVYPATKWVDDPFNH